MGEDRERRQFAVSPSKYGLDRAAGFACGMILCALVGVGSARAENSGGNMVAGREVFQMYCVPCHGSKGDGHGTLAPSLSSQPKDLTSPSYLRGVSDSYLAELITQGGGASHGQPMMPAWMSVLRHEDVAAVIAYIRSLERK